MKIKNMSEIDNLLARPYIGRKIHAELFDSLEREEVSVLYGPRQVGKSVEIALCMHELLKLNPKTEIFYFNLDNESKDFSDPDQFLVSILSQKNDSACRAYVFIDEAQRKDNIGLFIKYLYDKKENIKFFLTGSASLEIKTKIKEPLTGRKKEFFLGPLTLVEILKYKGINANNLQGYFDELGKILDEYLLYGGYPAVVAHAAAGYKKEKLEEVSQSYILRDVSALFDIHDLSSLEIISSFIAENIGNLISRENISRVSSASRHETEKILAALEKTFIFWSARPYAGNRVKEVTHRPKAYFYDLGIRNALLRKLDPALIASDKGKLFENMTANLLAAYYKPQYVKFWRTINQTEIDFIVEKEAGKIDVWEAKYSWEAKSLPRSVASFLSTYESIIEKTEVISRQTLYKLLKFLA